MTKPEERETSAERAKRALESLIEEIKTKGTVDARMEGSAVRVCFRLGGKEFGGTVFMPDHWREILNEETFASRPPEL